MNYRIIHGLDLVSVHPMAFKMSEGGNSQFFKKLFTQIEISYCRENAGSVNQALSFTARLAAKGAVAKMLGANYELVGHKNVEMINDDLGKPTIKLYGGAAELACRLGINEKDIAVSISHTDELVVASAMAIIRNEREAKKEVRKEEQRVANEKKTGRVTVIDTATRHEIKKLERTIANLFNAICAEAKLVLEIRLEEVDYNINYTVMDLKIGDGSPKTQMAEQVIARFTTHETAASTLPALIKIQFYEKYRNRLDNFVAAAKKAAEKFEVDIEIRVIKELSVR